LAVEFFRQGDIEAGARGGESTPIPNRENVADEPEREGCGADNRRELDKVDEIREEPVGAREMWVLEEANEPGLAPLVMWMCSPG